MRKLLPALAVAAVFSYAHDLFAQAPETFRARGRLWRATIDGTIQADDLGIGGTGIDLSSDLSQDDQINIDDITAIITLRGFGKINAQYWWGKWDADTVIPNNFTYAGANYTAGTLVSSKLDWQVWTFVFEYAVPGPGLTGGSSSLFAQGGFRYLGMEATISDAGQSNSARLKGLCPCLGFRGSMGLSQWLTVEAETNGSFVRSLSGGIDGTMWDASVALTAKFTMLYGGVGYRLLKMDMNDNRSNVDLFRASLEIKGIFFEVGIKF